MYSDSHKTMKPKNRFKKFQGHVLANKANILLWGTFFVFVLFVYHFLSDGDFSFLLTLGGIACCFAVVTLTVKILSQKSASGISVKTLELYAMVFFFRLCSILVYEGYLPFDKSGDWLYQAVEGLALVVSVINVFLVLGPYYISYSSHLDSFGYYKKVPHALGIIWIVVPCALLAIVIHPSLNGNFMTDVAWTFSCYLETFAMVPQLYLFTQKKSSNTVVEDFTSHFVFALGCGRFLHFIFWLSSYHELNDAYAATNDQYLGGAGYAGYMVVIMQFLQMCLMMNFIYHYLRSAATGTPMELPTHLSNV